MMRIPRTTSFWTNMAMFVLFRMTFLLIALSLITNTSVSLSLVCLFVCLFHLQNEPVVHRTYPNNWAPIHFCPHALLHFPQTCQWDLLDQDRCRNSGKPLEEHGALLQTLGLG
ncbi:hypothetical protein BDF14DRAFT_1838476 [Spinellus fusiger]|nr:hypothetical protein BDF14DRAFT_1838476 [Spinellus fusiger]